MWSRITYTFREMWASLSRSLTLTVAAVITATVTLFIFGLSLLIQRGFENQLSLWTGGVNMIVYMNNDATPDQIQYVKQALDSQPTIIASASYCDIPCSLAKAKTLFAASDSQLQLLTEKNIPSYFSIVPVTKDDTTLLQQIQKDMKGQPGVRDAVFASDQITTLRSLKRIIGLRTYIMSAVMLFTSALLIWNTIRTAMFARRREIEVMKLVGATNWFIRLPFMLEGLLQGVAGGALAGGFLLFANNDWTASVRAFPEKSGLKGFVVTDGYPWWVVLVLMTVGAVVGAIGSATAASRFLDV